MRTREEGVVLGVWRTGNVVVVVGHGDRFGTPIGESFRVALVHVASRLIACKSVLHFTMRASGDGCDVELSGVGGMRRVIGLVGYRGGTTVGD